jgi:predicted nucleic acid-binding Zn ribbon protein
MQDGDQTLAAKDWDDLVARRTAHQRRFFARRPKKIVDVLAELIAKRGYTRFQANEQLETVWRQASGLRLAEYSRPLGVRGGSLDVLVANSTVMQELNFQRKQILGELQRQLPDAQIRKIKFRVGLLS